jgi:hypothetical protein
MKILPDHLVCIASLMVRLTATVILLSPVTVLLAL